MEARFTAEMMVRTRFLSMQTASRGAMSLAMPWKSRPVSGACPHQRWLSTSSRLLERKWNNEAEQQASRDTRRRMDTITGRPIEGSETSSAPTQPPFGNAKTAQVPNKGRSSVDDVLAEAASPAYSWVAPATSARMRRGSMLTNEARDKFQSMPMLYPSALEKSRPRPRIIRELDVHVKPRLGRTISVDYRKPNELGMKIQQLTMLVVRNGIRAEVSKQRFYMRPGLVRKQKASLRWRRTFETRFKGTARRVNEMRKQGW